MSNLIPSQTPTDQSEKTNDVHKTVESTLGSSTTDDPESTKHASQDSREVSTQFPTPDDSRTNDGMNTPPPSSSDQPNTPRATYTENRTSKRPKIEQGTFETIPLETFLKEDKILSHHAEVILDSGIMISDIRELSETELEEFLSGFLQLGKMAARSTTRKLRSFYLGL